MDICPPEELLRLRPDYSPCSECFSYYAGIVENISKWRGNPRSQHFKTFGLIIFRVSCEESLETERPCPVMGHEGFEILLAMDGPRVLSPASVRPVKLRS